MCVYAKHSLEISATYFIVNFHSDPLCYPLQLLQMGAARLDNKFQFTTLYVLHSLEDDGRHSQWWKSWLDSKSKAV